MTRKWQTVPKRRTRNDAIRHRPHAAVSALGLHPTMTPSPSPSSSSSSADPQAIVLRPLTKCCSPASFKHFGCYSTTTTTTFYVLLLIALLPPAFSNAQKTSIGKPNKSRFTNAEIELIRRSFLKKYTTYFNYTFSITAQFTLI